MQGAISQPQTLEQMAFKPEMQPMSQLDHQLTYARAVIGSGHAALQNLTESVSSAFESALDYVRQPRKATALAGTIATLATVGAAASETEPALGQRANADSGGRSAQPATNYKERQSPIASAAELIVPFQTTERQPKSPNVQYFTWHYDGKKNTPRAKKLSDQRDKLLKDALDMGNMQPAASRAKRWYDYKSKKNGTRTWQSYVTGDGNEVQWGSNVAASFDVKGHFKVNWTYGKGVTYLGIIGHTVGGVSFIAKADELTKTGGSWTDPATSNNTKYQTDHVMVLYKKKQQK